MQALKIGPALPQACSMCPWRTENNGKPHHECEPGSDPVFYTAGRRRSMWEHFGPNGESLGGGTRMFCHKTGPCNSPGQVRADLALSGRVRWCTGGNALQQRAALRAFQTLELGPLKSWDAVRAIVAHMLDVRPGAIRTRRDHWTRAFSDRWTHNGMRVDLELLLGLCHPAVFDVGIGSEQVPPPTPDELRSWQLARLGAPPTTS